MSVVRVLYSVVSANCATRELSLSISHLLLLLSPDVIRYSLKQRVVDLNERREGSRRLSFFLVKANDLTTLTLASLG